MSVLPRVVAVVAVAVLSSCTAKVSGTPVAGATLPPEQPEVISSALAFDDDLTTVAPCSLTDPSVLESFGSAEFAAPESLDYCAVSVKPSAGGDVLILVGELGEQSEVPELVGKRVKELEGGLWVGQRDDTPSYCTQLLVFPDEVTMAVQGITVDGGDTDTCPMVEAAMDHAVEVILEVGVEHRDPADNSLVTLDPCSLVEDDVIAELLGVPVRQARSFPAKHSCFWDTGGDVTVRLQFVAGPVPTPNDRPGANADPVADRPTVTNPLDEVGDASYCSVETGHIPFEEVDGMDAMVEVASVYVRMPKGQVADGCRAAATVAQLVWPKLPDV